MLFEKKSNELLVMYAISPVHAGSGQSVGVVDLPIQRERHTGWPHIQSSGMKGALRDWFRRYYENNPHVEWEKAKDQAENLAKRVFGREEGSGGGDGHAGAISVTDARLLAFPVRSDIAPFVHVTCPSVLERLLRDVKLCSDEPDCSVPEIDGDDSVSITGTFGKSEIVLEDLVVAVSENTEISGTLKGLFAKLAPQAKRLLLISDANFSFLVKTATEVQPHIAIKFETGTTKDGSLRYQELLPADSLLYSLVFFSAERILENPAGTDVVKGWVKEAIGSHIQVGGDMTLGRGLMEVQWFSNFSG